MASSAAHAGAQAAQEGKRFARFGANGVVEVHVGGADCAFAVDDVTRRQRQFPGRVAVEFCEVHLELDVDLRQILRQRKSNSEAARDFVVDVAENVEREMELLFCGQAMFGKLRRESHNCRAEGFKFTEVFFQSCQLQFAVSSPHATEKSENQRPFGKKVARADDCAARIG